MSSMRFRGAKDPETTSKSNEGKSSDESAATHASPQSTIGNRSLSQMLGQMNESSASNVAQPDIVGTKTLASGTSLYHGTRWKEGAEKWWEEEGAFPNKEGEDGGVSFTLDSSASPKTKNANIIIEYELTGDVDAVHCRHKGDFIKVFNNKPSAVCYTDTEQEVVIKLAYLAGYLKYVGAWSGF